MRTIQLLYILGAFAIALGARNALAGSGEANLTLEAPEAISGDSEEFDVEVIVHDADNLGAFEFILNFDPAVLEAVSAVQTDYLASSGREVFCVEPEIADAAIRVECLTLGPTPAEGVSGEGTIAVITMRSTGDGSSGLTLSRVKLAQPDGTDIDVTWDDSSISTSGGRDWAPIFIGGSIGFAALLVVAGGAALLLRRRRSPAAAGAALESRGGSSRPEP
jgi:hypothetical protein